MPIAGRMNAWYSARRENGPPKGARGEAISEPGTSELAALRAEPILAAFACVGAVEGKVAVQRWFMSGLETLTVGGAAAAIAYFTGWLLKAVVGVG